MNQIHFGSFFSHHVGLIPWKAVTQAKSSPFFYPKQAAVDWNLSHTFRYWSNQVSIFCAHVVSWGPQRIQSRSDHPYYPYHLPGDRLASTTTPKDSVTPYTRLPETIRLVYHLWLNCAYSGTENKPPVVLQMVESINLVSLFPQVVAVSFRTSIWAIAANENMFL